MDISKSPQTKIRNLYQSVLSDPSTLIDSDTLFKNGDVVFILHKGEQYSLRRTRNGKLILNK
ncbi:MAG: hemin uptake protein HemP [Nitrosomonas sp.]|nr:hemin uptake protein HemP [Nitrosomonas sp.]